MHGNVPEDRSSGITLVMALGHVLVVLGWIAFAVALWEMLTVPTEEDGKSLFFSGVFIVPGWLLLRLGEGVFPFGKRFFR